MSDYNRCSVRTNSRQSRLKRDINKLITYHSYLWNVCVRVGALGTIRENGAIKCVRIAIYYNRM